LIDLFKKNIDRERWGKIFKPRFMQILKEEDAQIEIESLKQ
jgi:hypothetical protein